VEFVAKELHTNIDRLIDIYNSAVHGSVDLDQFLNCDKEEFDSIIEEYQQKECDRLSK